MLERIVEKTTYSDFFIVLITSFALISFWRGVWGLLDFYLFPHNLTLSLWISVVIGLFILLIIAWYKKDRLKKAGEALSGK